MISREFVENKVSEIKQKMRDSMERADYDGVLSLLSLAADVLYQTNIYYRDDALEQVLKEIAGKVAQADPQYRAQEQYLLFWDGFGLNSRGLVQIYLKALCKYKKVIYVTYADREGQIPDVLSLLKKADCEALFIERGRKLREIRQLEAIVRRFSPAHFFLYSTPDDVTAISVMYAYEDKLIRYQINLTDHAFWLGAGCLDKCIEFREYGANISSMYRGVEKEKIVYLPYYPAIDLKQEFEGYPFPFDPERQKLIFSGGALYKTLGEGNVYYKIVDYILSRHPEAVFWYAGTGDSGQMKEILLRYPGRAFLTPERKDLFQVMRHCTFYLNTYPFVGGLMMQYAAAAGKIPVTLRHGQDGSGIFIGQEELGIEFDSLSDLYREVDRLLTDTDYLQDKCTRMEGSVVSEEIFEGMLSRLLREGRTGLPIRYRQVDTDDLREIYLSRISKGEFYGYFARKDAAVCRAFPPEFVGGGYTRCA